MRNYFLLAAVILLLSGCQLIPQRSQMIPYEGGYFRLEHAWPYEQEQWLQHVVLTYGNERHEFLLSSLFKQEELLVVGLTLTGQELFRVGITNNSIYMGGEHLPDPRLPLRMVAEMQLTLLPEAVLRSRIKGLTIEDTVDEVWLRKVYKGNQLVLTIKSDIQPLYAETITIEHTEYQVTLSILSRNILEGSNE